jgi:peptidoglycan/LPS O-acetylase OafA/YrhL
MRYVPALDGLRALAVLAVVGVHAGVPGMSGGFIGVDVFFVLSGYLITQTLEEHPDLPRFYWRRAKRLIPALALMLAAYLVFAPLIWPRYPHLRDAGFAFFYLSDYTRALWQMPRYLGHTWSLSVEEHFYLLWPLVFVRWRPSVVALALAYELLTLWRWTQGDYSTAYFRFDAHCTGLVLGCLIARMKHKPAPAWPGLLVLGACLVFLPIPWQNYLSRLIGMTLVEVAAAVVIVGRPPAWMSDARLAYLGKLSYGIYLWHFPITKALEAWPWQTKAPATLVASVALAAISYHTIEALVRSPRPREHLRLAGSPGPGCDTPGV